MHGVRLSAMSAPDAACSDAGGEVTTPPPTPPPPPPSTGDSGEVQALPQSQHPKLTVTINGKTFCYQGKPEHRERDFFQLYVKATKGTPVTKEDAMAVFRANIPDSKLAPEVLEALFLKHSKRRVEKDAGGGASTPLCEPVPQAVGEPAVAVPPPKVQENEEVVVEVDNDATLLPPSLAQPLPSESPAGSLRQLAQAKAFDAAQHPLKAALSDSHGTAESGDSSPKGVRQQLVRGSLDSNAGWAEQPVRKESTAWERELVRRRERVQSQSHSQESLGAPPPTPPMLHRSHSPSLPTEEPQPQPAAAPRRHHSSKSDLKRSKVQPSHPYPALRLPHSTPTPPSQDRKDRKERKEDKGELQKMMSEILQRTKYGQSTDTSPSPLFPKTPHPPPATARSKAASHTWKPTSRSSLRCRKG